MFIKLSSKITGFTESNLNSITITNQTGDVVAVYPRNESSILKNRITNNVSPSFDNNLISKNKNIIDNNTNNSVINLNDLAAQASGSEYPVTDSSKSAYFWFGLFGVIIIGITMVIKFILQKNA